MQTSAVSRSFSVFGAVENSQGYRMSVRLMHLADLHLGAPLAYLGEKAAQRSEELESALTRALELAPEKNVHAVVIAGDLFDSFNPPPELAAGVKAAFQKLTETGTPVILIPGTHDSHRYSRCIYRRTEFSGLDILLDAGKPVRKCLNGHEVHFYGYSGASTAGRDAPPFRRGASKGIHVALAHGPVVEAGHWTPGSRDFPITPKELEASGFDYVALGHHHNLREFKFGKSSAVYPGTLEGLKFGENGARHLIIAEISEAGVVLEKIKHNRRTLSEVNIDLALAGIASGRELAAAIAKHSDPDGIVRVSLTGTADFPPAPREVQSCLADRFFHLEIADETSMVDSEMIRSIMKENTVRGIFARKMLERIDQSGDEDRAVAEMALRLGIEQFVRVPDENN